MFDIRKYYRRKEGEKLIEETLIRSYIRDKIDIISNEIETLINLKLVVTNSMNIYSSKTGKRVRFYYLNSEVNSIDNIDFFPWEGWHMLRSRIQFELGALRAGVRGINEIQYKV